MKRENALAIVKALREQLNSMTNDQAKEAGYKELNKVIWHLDQAADHIEG